MIRRFIWRVRFALRLRACGDFPFRLGFMISADSFDACAGACPIESADEELSYWVDD